jgi:hypothetical protein
MPDNTHFYTKLPVHKDPISGLLGQPQAFERVPGDWWVIITDIKNSTAAIRVGQHQTVNLVATGSIISTINIAKKQGTQIPFFFGGDGATLLVPDCMKEAAFEALIRHRENTFANFDLELRVGCMSVSSLYWAGKNLEIAKVALEKDFDVPLVLGEGLRFAEKIIKSESFTVEEPSSSQPVLDLEGMNCRWDKIEPPGKRLEIVCLIIDARNENSQRTAFQKVMNSIDSIYGSPRKRKPLSTQQLHLKVSWKRIITESKVKFGHLSFFYVLWNWLLTGFGPFYFAVNDEGKQYLKELVEWSDTLVIDGRIHTIITGTERQRAELVKILDELETTGDILYGIHISPQSIMSCYVRKGEKQHLHFVDGSEGGYTKAAGVLKKKWRGLKE